jgi:FMN reductase
MSAPAAPVVQLIGNPRAGSRTRVLSDLVARALPAALVDPGGPAPGAEPAGAGDEPVVIELAEAVGVTFGPEAAKASLPVDDAFGLVRRSRLLVVATPTYKGTYSGLLKLFLDQLDQGDLAGTVAVPVAIAGSAAHRESVASALSQLLVELGADVPAPAVALLEAEVAAQQRHVDEWVATHATTVSAALARVAARVGVDA